MSTPTPSTSAQTRRGGGGGWERVAGRARAEGPLERILQPGDLFQAESGEARELRRIGLCDLREALFSTRPVSRKGRERWAGGRTPKDGRRVSTSVLFTRGMLVNPVRSVHALADQHGQVALGLFVS